MAKMLFIGGSRRAQVFKVSPVFNGSDAPKMPENYNLPEKLSGRCIPWNGDTPPPVRKIERYTLKHIGTNRGIDMVYVNDELTEKEAMDIYNEYVGAK